MQSHDERDMGGLAARKERGGVVITVRRAGEPEARRAVTRAPDERFSNLKQLARQEKYLTETLAKKSAERFDDRAHLSLTAELDVDRAQLANKLGVLS